MSLFFLGSDSPQSRATLAELARQDCLPEQVFVHGPASLGAGMPGIVSDTGGVTALAATLGLPTHRLPPARLFDALALRAGDTLLVSCYPTRVPDRVLRHFHSRCFNIHPSPLPAWRGPSPIFWQLHAGCSHIGVSLHRMIRCFDAGPLLARTRFAIADPVSWAGLHEQAGRLGARLFVSALRKRRDERPRETDETRASHRAAPCFADFEVSSTWSRRHAMNFIDGVMAIGRPWIRTATGEPLPLHSARIPTLGTRPGKNLGAAELPFACRDGWLVVTVDDQS